jgi:hypothetical protein
METGGRSSVKACPPGLTIDTPAGHGVEASAAIQEGFDPGEVVVGEVIRFGDLRLALV